MTKDFEGRGCIDRRRVQVVDTESGKDLDLVVMVPRVPHPYDRWIAMKQARLAWIARDPSLSPCALRLLLMVLSDVEGGNAFRLSQSEAARALGYTRRQVNRAWAQLRELGLIEQTDDDGRQAWGVAPEVAWRGKAKGLRKVLQEREDRRSGLRQRSAG